MSVSIEDMYEQKRQIEANKFLPKEAYNRLVISRGYYASFSHACELIKNNNILLIKKDPFGAPYGPHERYYQSLIACNHKELIEVGNKLKNYHTLRKKADYRLNQHVTDLDVKIGNQYLEECKQLMDAFVQSKSNSNFTINTNSITTA